MTDLSQYSDAEIMAAAGLSPRSDGSDNTLSVRNNNPGNIMTNNSFASYDTPQAGLNAMQHDLMLKVSGNSPMMKANYGNDYQPTLRNVITTWAPPSQNDTENYIKFVSDNTGIHPDQVLTKDDVPTIMQPMIHMEGGKQASDYFGKLMSGVRSAIVPDANASENIQDNTAGGGRAQDNSVQPNSVSDSKTVPESINPSQDLSQYSDDEIRAAAGLPPSAGQNIKTDITNRAIDTLQNIDKGSLGFLQLEGQLAGAGLNAAKEGIKAITPDSVKQGIQNATDWVGDKLLASGAAPAIDAAGNAIRGAGNEFAQTFPAQARNLQAEGNILAASPIIEGAAAIPSGLSKIAEVTGKNDIGNPASSSIFGNTSGLTFPRTVTEPPPQTLLKTDMGKPLLVAPQAIKQGASDLGSFLQSDGIDLNKVADDLEAAQKINPNVRAIDVMATDENGIPKGNNVLGLAKSIAQSPGQGRTLAGEMTGRGYTASQRIGDSLDQSISKAPYYNVQKDAIQTMDGSGDLYTKAYAANKDVSSPVINRLLKTDAGKQALAYAANRMNTKMSLMGVPDPELAEQAKLVGRYQSGGISKGLKLETLQYVKEGYDNQISSAFNAGEKGKAADLIEQKNGLLNELDKADQKTTGGAYAQARQTYSTGAKIKDALEQGRSFMSQDPEEIAEFINDKGRSNPEKVAYATGVRRAIQDMIDNKSETTNPIQALWKPSLQKRLQPLFPDKASFDNFSANMEHEKTMSRVDKIMQGSPTYANEAFSKQPEAGAVGKTLRFIGNAMEPGMLVGKLGDIADKALQKRATEMSVDSKAIAMRYLTTKDPELLRYLAKQTQEKAPNSVTKH